jgi:hypothetical protein
MNKLIKTILSVMAAALLINGTALANGPWLPVEKIYDYSDIAKAVDRK